MIVATIDNGTYFAMYLWGWYLIRNLGNGFIEAIASISPTADAAAKLGGTVFSLSQLFAGIIIHAATVCILYISYLCVSCVCRLLAAPYSHTTRLGLVTFHLYLQICEYVHQRALLLEIC